MKEKDDEILTQLSRAKTVCEFCKILNVEMYAKNGDEENLPIDIFMTYCFRELTVCFYFMRQSLIDIFCYFNINNFFLYLELWIF